LTVALDDGWQLRGFLGEEWRWQLEKPMDAPGWIPASVPGSVIDDLWRAGEVPDPYVGRNSRLVEWVPARSWVYRRRVEGPGMIRFAGVDHAASVHVDGEEAARHEGAFTHFDVSIGAGEHLLAVVVEPAPQIEPQVGRTSKVRVHKSRMGYGWDFCPRMIHQGIWRPVTLHRRAPRDIFPLVRLEDGVGTVAVDGETVLRVESPRLWWPNGMGEQHLYEVDLDGRAWTVGFRTIELDGCRFVVNGRPMPVRGWNWVPIDALYGVPRPEKVAHLLRLAAKAHVNLLRVWGGGIIETDELYDACDRLGLLVWQEFSQSSSGIENVPSDDPAFVELMARDARAVVPRRRHHASLAVWCGGNELDADGTEPVLEALADVVRELDPDRAWLPTSPSRDELDVHGPWEHQGLGDHYAHYDAGSAVLHSEFGVEGMTNRRALERLVPEGERWPADRSNPVYEHLGAWWNNEPLVQAAFGGRLAGVDSLRRASQHLQYDGLRYAVEASRRRGCGTIPWQLNEPYPMAWSTTAVDHRGDPKPAYYGVARAYRPVHPCASFTTCAWGAAREARATLWSLGTEERAVGRFVAADGTAVAEAVGGELVAPLDAFPTDVFVLDVRVGDVRNRYVMTRTADLAPLLDLEPAALEVERVDDELRLRHTGGPAALGIVVEDARAYDEPGWVGLDDNVIDLLPGESTAIEVVGGGPLLVEGWNVEARRVG
jgi:beta-mannosidase